MDKLRAFLKAMGTWLRKHRALAAAGLVILLGLAVWGAGLRWAWPDWTGFGPTVDADGKIQPGKTLWDWLQLLVIPVVLSLGALFFDRQEKKSDERKAEALRERELAAAEAQRKRELEIADFNRQEAVLKDYLDKISGLILDRNLMEINAAAAEIYPTDSRDTQRRIDDLLDATQRGARHIAQIWTITALRQLRVSRRNILCQFLRDANLKNFIFESASIYGLDLSNTNLEGMNFSHAQFLAVNLREANFSGAVLIGAEFPVTHLDRTNFTNANLFAAQVYDSQLKYTRGQLSGATLPDGRKFDPEVNKTEFGGLKWNESQRMEEIQAQLTAMLEREIKDMEKMER